MSDFQPILLDLPLPIMTPRLMIRPVMPGDGQATHDAIEETVDQLHQWMPWAGKQLEPSETEINIREAHAKFILRKDFRMNGYE
ncbi:MAG: GNAT family N-acetyltransferase, partial [Geminicoccaceae bacterium]